ncbi:MAG: hypothetical protein IMZ58_10325 [Thermoplasmata archaeon]|nr:hypothetical protein [Thermoplasmata archaeon]
MVLKLCPHTPIGYKIIYIGSNIADVKFMNEIIEVPIDKRGRMTLPPEVREHLKLKIEDKLWFKKTGNGKFIMGKIEINKKIIE